MKDEFWRIWKTLPEEIKEFYCGDDVSAFKSAVNVLDEEEVYFLLEDIIERVRNNAYKTD